MVLKITYKDFKFLKIIENNYNLKKNNTMFVLYQVIRTFIEVYCGMCGTLYIKLNVLESHFWTFLFSDMINNIVTQSDTTASSSWS